MSKYKVMYFIGAIFWLVVAMVFLLGDVNCKNSAMSAKMHILNGVCETVGEAASFMLAMCLSIICAVLAIKGTNET